MNLQRNDWDELLPFACFALNASLNATTGTTPHLMLHGQQPLLAAHVATSIPAAPFSSHLLDQFSALWDATSDTAARAQQRQRDYADRFRTDVQFQLGDLVLLNKAYRCPNRSVPKLAKHWDGPFPIIEKINSVTYRLRFPPKWSRLHPVIWVGYLKAYDGDEDLPPPPSHYDEDNEPHYEVETIVDHRGKRPGRRHYLIHWLGFSDNDRSWLPEKDLAGAATLVNEYNAHHNLAAAAFLRAPILSDIASATPEPT